jgi:hypothetical protein
MALLRLSHWRVLRSFWHRSHTNPRPPLCSETFQSIVRMLLFASHPCKHLRKLTAVGDDDLGLGGAGGRTVGLDLLDNVKALDDLAEDDVLAVQPRGLLSADEELGAVARRCQRLRMAMQAACLRVGAGVGHGEDTGASVLQGEVLVPELLAVDGLTAGTVTGSEVTTLKHELGDDPVEGSTLEVEGLAAAAGTLLTSAESAEVLGGLFIAVSSRSKPIANFS